MLESILISIKPYINQITFTIGAISIAFLIQVLFINVSNWLSKKISSKTRTKFDDEFLPLISRLLCILIWIITFILILIQFGIDIKSITATLGIASLTIALAIKDTISNVIAGLIIMTDKPFRVKDYIKLISGEKVIVQDIGVRRSRFVLEDKSGILIIPNSDLSKSKIINFTYAENEEK